MNFSVALDILKDGGSMHRSGWNDKHQRVFITGNNPHPNPIEVVPTVPYIVIETNDRQIVPWLASQTDLLADDWQEVN